MKHLIIYSHPNPNSFCHAIQETYLNELKSRGCDIRVRDLYAIQFDPVLRGSDFEALEQGRTLRDVEIEQGHVRWADSLTFIYPLWWTALPAVLKGYVDRVFSLGFAYAYDENGPKGLLQGKKVYMMTTMGAPESIYEQIGMFKSMKQTIDEGIIEFCGMESLGHKYFGEVPKVSDEARHAMLEEVKQTVLKIHK
jgi:NAD(P)H dehydrogenase (quinone)